VDLASSVVLKCTAVLLSHAVLLGVSPSPFLDVHLASATVCWTLSNTCDPGIHHQIWSVCGHELDGPVEKV
jgi:hypothetical protein